MYKEFFGLRANPFNVNPDPRYLFLTRHTEEALACLTYGIQSRKGFVLAYRRGRHRQNDANQ